MDFISQSYSRHGSHRLNDGDEVLSTTFKEGTVDHWRQQRIYNLLLPFVRSSERCKWLTVGDGRYGTDACYLLGFGHEVLATDIAGDGLKIAKERGYITDYRIENAEKMSFSDESFDFVLCKEACHHFPRPFIAIYEMLRVARKGIILIEPKDGNLVIPQKQSFKSALFWFIQAAKNSVKRFLNKPVYYNPGNYEEIGNYVYSLSDTPYLSVK